MFNNLCSLHYTQGTSMAESHNVTCYIQFCSSTCEACISHLRHCPSNTCATYWLMSSSAQTCSAWTSSNTLFIPTRAACTTYAPKGSHLGSDVTRGSGCLLCRYLAAKLVWCRRCYRVEPPRAREASRGSSCPASAHTTHGSPKIALRVYRDFIHLDET